MLALQLQVPDTPVGNSIATTTHHGKTFGNIISNVNTEIET